MTTSIQRFIKDLEEALAWCEKLGVKHNSGRFGEYVDAIEKAIDDNEGRPRSKDPFLRKAIEAIESGQELILIKKCLGDIVEPNKLSSRLKKYLRGTAFESEESIEDNSHHPRNFGFELVLAAQLANTGLKVELPPNGDISIKHPSINIECKRLQGHAGLKSSFKKAVDQLKNRQNIGRDMTGIVAISVGKSIHRGNHFIELNDEISLSAALSNTLGEFRKTHMDVWSSRKIKHVQAILLYISTIAHITSTNRWLWAHYMLLNQLNFNCNASNQDDIAILRDALERAIKVNII